MSDVLIQSIFDMSETRGYFEEPQSAGFIILALHTSFSLKTNAFVSLDSRLHISELSAIYRLIFLGLDLLRYI